MSTWFEIVLALCAVTLTALSIFVVLVSARFREQEMEFDKQKTKYALRDGLFDTFINAIESHARLIDGCAYTNTEILNDYEKYHSITQTCSDTDIEAAYDDLRIWRKKWLTNSEQSIKLLSTVLTELKTQLDKGDKS